MGQSFDPRQDDGSDLERQLGAFVPRESRVNRATLLFRAGQESARLEASRRLRSARLWPLSTALLALLAMGLAWRLFAQPQPQLVERIKYIPIASLVADKAHEAGADTPNRGMPDSGWDESASPRATRSALTRNHYVNQRRLALTMGLDALSDPWGTGGTGGDRLASYRELTSDWREREASRPADDSDTTDDRHL